MADWLAVKEYDEAVHSYLDLYIELKTEDEQAALLDCQMLQELLSVYFRSYDGDYKDLKRLLGMDPLRITLLKTGTMERYRARTGRRVPPVGAPREVVLDCSACRPGRKGGAYDPSTKPPLHRRAAGLADLHPAVAADRAGLAQKPAGQRFIIQLLRLYRLDGRFAVLAHDVWPGPEFWYTVLDHRHFSCAVRDLQFRLPLYRIQMRLRARALLIFWLVITVLNMGNVFITDPAHDRGAGGTPL